MSNGGQFLIDHTRDHLIEAAEYAAQKQTDDLCVQILVLYNVVVVRAFSAAAHRTWMHDSCDWDKLATETVNPLLALIDGILFRLERLKGPIAAAVESGQEARDGGEQNPA